MLKSAVKRGLAGIPLGIAVSFLITLAISLIYNDGKYYPVVPEFAEAMGNELNAVLLQTILSGLFGMVCGGISVIWNIERWSLLKQSVVFFLILLASMLSVAYACYWMQRSAWGAVSYIAIFVVTFFFVWTIQFLVFKRKIKRMNQKLQ